jgi:uncharacterized protein YraI
VLSIPPTSLLNLNGCLDDWTWCDVDWEGNRGWVYGNYVFYDYQSRRVPVIQFGASLGIGIVAFNIGDYWGRYVVVVRRSQPEPTVPAASRRHRTRGPRRTQIKNKFRFNRQKTLDRSEALIVS